MADYVQMRRDWEALGRRMEGHERHLQTRKVIIKSFILGIAPPSPSEVAGPMLELQNMDDFEHAD
ncbi:hypothetical protein PHMEG_0005849 [Phytophthora megakarya]|uniref:Uncharacterized protein n=1 Tax=Phytophthora megakarya TaxID=4795 RepID=A0A225WRZ0_9STRA|nr:hypothetical protein PHMEG_0005849 [Phytophthora megakarya]